MAGEAARPCCTHQGAVQVPYSLPQQWLNLPHRHHTYNTNRQIAVQAFGLLGGCFGKTSHRFWTSNTPPRIHVKTKEEPKKAKKGGKDEHDKKGVNEDEGKEGGGSVVQDELQGGFEFYLHHSMKRRRRKLERAKKKERPSESKGEGGGVQGGVRFNEKFYDELRIPEMDIYKKFLPMKCCLRYKFGYPALTEEEWKKGYCLDIYKGLFFKRICEVLLIFSILFIYILFSILFISIICFYISILFYFILFYFISLFTCGLNIFSHCRWWALWWQRTTISLRC